jgi:hypothetical protein
MAATKIRKSAAYNAINSCRFRGNQRNWTLDNFIDSHAAAHAELLELREPVSETKKVTEFLAVILNPKLEMAKAHILGMDALNENFSACQNYIKTYHLNVMESEKTQRIISQITQGPRTQTQGSYQPKKKARKGAISNKEWDILSETQKQVIRDKRESDKLSKKRSVSKTVTISQDPATPPNAGTEFVKNVHKKAKK